MSPKRRAKAARTRTEGVKLLRVIVKRVGRAAVARKAKVTELAVRHWCDEQRRPAADARLALCKQFDIPLEAWELIEPDAASPARRPIPRGGEIASIGDGEVPADTKLDPGLSAKELARLQVERIANRIARAQASEIGAREMSALEASYTGAVRLFSRLSGELEITESALLRSTAWAKVQRVLDDVFDRYPDAGREFAEAIATLEGAAA